MMNMMGDDLTENVVKSLCSEEGSSSKSVGKTKLNAMAKEWDPAKERPPEEMRCLYVTFSAGYPLNEYEITYFFNQCFGDCVEKVIVHKPPGNEGAGMYAKVVFLFSSIPVSVLGKTNEARFIVNSKTMWCKRFDPRKSKNLEE